MLKFVTSDFNLTKRYDSVSSRDDSSEWENSDKQDSASSWYSSALVFLSLREKNASEDIISNAFFFRRVNLPYALALTRIC